MAKHHRPGIRCSVCDTQDNAVTQTAKGHRHITRRRKCNTCGHSFKTIELLASHIPSDSKFDFLYRQESQS